MEKTLKLSAEKIIEQLDLKKHPEGGYFKETYRSEGIIPQISLENSYNGNRNYSTGIYFLLTSSSFSAFHRIKQDEMWHFYGGSPLYVHVINKGGEYHRYKVGMNLLDGEQPQLVVPGDCWFASSVVEENSYSFVGCTVAPGFDFADFELANRKSLVAEYPQHDTIITSLTR